MTTKTGQMIKMIMRMFWKSSLMASMLTLFLMETVLAGQGIVGRAAYRGRLFEETYILVYSSLDNFARKVPDFVSEPTNVDGQYRLSLPPGEYYLVAAKGAGWPEKGKPSPGDYYCFYGNNPITVYRDQWTQVGFNMIKVPQDGGEEESATAIAGQVLFEDEPLERAYLYVYRPDQPRFHGPGHTFVPIGNEGRFKVRLRSGNYYLVVRKRQKGSLSGPISQGDYLGFYYGNPVVVTEGREKRIILEAVQRLDYLEESLDEPQKPPLAMGFTGTVIDSKGKPIPEIQILAYKNDSDGTGTPSFISEPTDSAGRFTLPVARPGEYLLIARETIGGKARQGEWYGRLGGQSIALDRMIREVSISVARVKGGG